MFSYLCFPYLHFHPSQIRTSIFRTCVFHEYIFEAVCTSIFHTCVIHPALLTPFSRIRTCIFSPPCPLHALELGRYRGSPSNWVSAQGVKNEWWAYRAEQEVWRYLQPPHATDGQTPGDCKDRAYKLDSPVGHCSPEKRGLHCIALHYITLRSFKVA